MRAQLSIPLRLALVGALFCGVACQGAPSPLRPPTMAYRGQKARVFPNTPEEVWEASRSTLMALGFVLREEDPSRGFLHAHTIELEGSSAATGTRTWTRVTARIDFVDQHKRAPRSMLELEAERLRGTAEGPIEASIGELEIDFYERFFRDVEARLPVPRLPQLGIPGLD